MLFSQKLGYLQLSPVLIRSVLFLVAELGFQGPNILPTVLRHAHI